MKTSLRTRNRTAKMGGLRLSVLLSVSLSGVSLAGLDIQGGQAAYAQAPAPAAANRFLGTITALGAGQLTVKTDAGAVRQVTVPDGIKMQRIAPGEKDLSKAATIQFSDLAVGDRVLVRLAPDATTDPVTASSIVAIQAADLAQKQEQERDAWTRNGVGGLVKSVDASAGVIEITSGAGPTQKAITLHIAKATILRRYAADSVSFDLAKAAPIDTIHAGDQLRARGTKNADGSEVAADEVVSGSFRNVAGTVSSINAADHTVTVKDLTTKHDVVVHIGPDAQMRKLPEAMSKMLATPGTGGAAPAGSGDSGRRAAGGGDPQQMLARAPIIHLADLQKGDAVMLVSTQGTSDVTAVTLLAGVEALLTAPASTQNMLMQNWSVGSGGGEGGEAAQ